MPRMQHSVQITRILLRGLRPPERLRDERADIERQSVGAHPVAVLLQGDQLRAAHHLAEGVIEDVIPERWAKITDDHCVAVIARLLELGEVALDLVV